MKALILLSFLATCSALCADEKRASQTIPAKAYHVILHTNQQWSVPQVIGRIPEGEQMEIRVSADKVASDKSVSLTGNAIVTVSVGGKAITTYEGPELVLTPVASAATPLTYQECEKSISELDEAIARRDVTRVLEFFAGDANITVETLTPTGKEARTLTLAQFGEYLKSVFPNALRIKGVIYGWSPRDRNTQAGTVSAVSRDGLSAEITSNARFAVTLPEGELSWDLMRQMKAEKRGEKVLITSLDIRLPRDISENWPEPKNPTRRGFPTPPTPVLPR